MNEVVVAAPQDVALSTADVMSRVLEASRDPNIDVTKFEAMIRLAERVQDRTARQEFFRALNQAQREMPRIVKRGDIPGKGGQKQSRYAKLEDVDEAIRPIYERHGFAVTFPGAKVIDGKTIYFARVCHVGGHVEEYSMPLALDTSGSKNDTQGGGSTMSYARRYLLKSIFNLIEKGEDTDGNPPQYMSETQLRELRELCDMTATKYETLAAVYGAPSIEAMPAAMYGAALGMLRKKAGR